MTTNALLRDQLDFHWQHRIRERLEGLTDEEYLWEPVPGSWNVHPGDGDTPATIDFEYPEPTPTPVTTIAWRLAHVIVGVLAMRNAGHFGREATDHESYPYSPTAAGALAQLDEEYAAWQAGVEALGEEGLTRAVGEAEGDYAESTYERLVLHINREVIHHLAEVALLRDLYAHRTEA